MILSKNDIMGALAMWAVRQSPYDVPENLETVLKELGEKLSPDFSEMCEHKKFDSNKDIANYLKPILLSIPELVSWNERKNGNSSPFGFVTRFDRPDPDDDFIDLDALLWNIVHTVSDEFKKLEIFSE